MTGAKRYSADVKQGGLEIPCILKFEIDSEKLKCLLDKMKKLVSFALGKGEVQLAHLTQELHHKEDGESNITEVKKMKLSECKNLIDWQRDIMDGKFLSDIPINFAQCLLKKQFPDLKGLQPTVYQQRTQTAESESQMKQ